MKEYAVVFLAWGENFIKEVCSCILKSEPYITGFDIILITDKNTDTKDVDPLVFSTVRVEFEQTGLLRKTELHKFLPKGYACYLLLDSDTIVIGDISLGFKKALIHGIAACPAPHYSLDAFWDFGGIMRKEGMSTSGQLQYNTGIIFFNCSQNVKAVFSKWGALGQFYQKEFKNDQPFFTLAMEQLEFNPYTLSVSYNYRAFGDAISGDIRIWHSHGSIPKNINRYKHTWPPRKAWPGKVVHPTQTKKKVYGYFLQKIEWIEKRIHQFIIL